jgi:hypothetical protein
MNLIINDEVVYDRYNSNDETDVEKAARYDRDCPGDTEEQLREMERIICEAWGIPFPPEIEVSDEERLGQEQLILEQNWADSE